MTLVKAPFSAQRGGGFGPVLLTLRPDIERLPGRVNAERPSASNLSKCDQQRDGIDRAPPRIIGGESHAG